MESFSVTFEVPMGWMALVGHEKGIERIYLPERNQERLEKMIFFDFPKARAGRGTSFLSRARRELEEYFLGKREDFGFPLDLSAATDFQKKVYRQMIRVPKGQVRTYGWIARKIGHPQALRAVGGANARNRWPIVIP